MNARSDASKKNIIRNFKNKGITIVGFLPLAISLLYAVYFLLFVYDAIPFILRFFIAGTAFAFVAGYFHLVIEELTEA